MEKKSQYLVEVKGTTSYLDSSTISALSMIKTLSSPILVIVVQKTLQSPLESLLAPFPSPSFPNQGFVSALAPNPPPEDNDSTKNLSFAKPTSTRPRSAPNFSHRPTKGPKLALEIGLPPSRLKYSLCPFLYQHWVM